MFGRLETEVGPLSDKARLLAAVLASLSLPHCLGPTRGWRGRPSKDRAALAAAFLAKAICGLQTTRQLLERLRVDHALRLLCGWTQVRDLPHESTFSRAFAEFAESELPQQLHAALIESTQKERLIGHNARDATAIEAREKFPESKPKKKEKGQRRPKRPSLRARHAFRTPAGTNAGRATRRAAHTLRHRNEKEQQRAPAILARL